MDNNMCLCVQAPGSAFSAVNLFQTEAPLKSGPIISDITDQATPSPVEDNSDWLEDRLVP